MTEAQSKRTRLEVWKDILAAAGGTAHREDTLYRTIWKTADAAGVTPIDSTAPASRLVIFDIVNALGGTAGFNDTIYQLERKLMALADPAIGCCNLPPFQSIDSGGISGGPVYLLDEQGNPILDENGLPILLEGTDYPPNPFAYWKMNDADPAVTLVNVIDGFNLTAIDVGGISVAGKIGNARQMGYFAQDWWQSTATSHWAMPGSFTVRFWIKLSAYYFIAGATELLRAGDPSPAPAQWNIGLMSDTYGGLQMFMRFSVVTTGSPATVDLTSPLNLGAWNHVMFWFEQGVGCKVQLNNGAIISGAANASPISPFGGGTPLHLRQTLISQQVQMDEIAIYDELLTTAQRATDYNSGFGLTFPL